MYVGYHVDDMENGCLLIFANNVKEAKRVSYKEIMGWTDCYEYIHVIVRRIWTDVPHLHAVRDLKLFNEEIPHIIDNPPSCASCELWGWGEDQVIENNGNCKGCNEGEE